MLRMKSIKMNKKLFLLIVSLCFFVCCTNTKEDYLDLDPFIFVSVTNKHDTCTIGTFTSALYYELNIKCMSELDFYEYIEDAIEKKQALVVSDDYFLVCQKDSITRSNIADSIYNECGLVGLEHYVENSPLVIFEKADQEAFEWAAYILWENNIRVSIADEDASWCVERVR